MRYSTGRQPRPRVGLLLTFLLVASSGGAETPSPVAIDAIAGWGGVVRTEAWAPFVVTVDNRGPVLEATVSVEVFRGSELRGTLVSQSFERAVELPARARRRFWFSAPIATVSRPAVVRVTTEGITGTRELARLEVPLAKISVSHRIVVAVSSEIAFDFLAQEGSRVVYPHAENLPDSWVGWSGVDLVVVRDTAFHRLGAAQVTALAQWAQAGGTIVFAGGAPALQFAGTGLAGLLPVEIAGLAERAALPSLGRLAGVAPPAGPVTVAGSKVRDGAAVLAAEGDLPLVVARREGAGSVVWLAFDPSDRAFAAWPGRTALWRLAAGDAALVSSDHGAPREPLDDPWIAPLASRSDVAFPSHARLAVFLGAFLLPAFLLLLLPRRRVPWLDPRFRAGGLLVLACAASAAGWFVFNRWIFRGSDFLLEAARLDAVHGVARLSRRLAVCSVSGGGFALSLGRGEFLLEDVGAVGRGRPAMPLAIELGDATKVHGGVPGRFQSRLFAADAMIPFALSAALVPAPEGRALIVENRSGTTIRGAFLVSGSLVAPLGDLPPGPAASHAIGGSTEPGAHPVGALMSDPARRALWERESGSIGRAGPVLVGWLDEPPLAARLGDAAPAASVCLVTLEVDQR